MRVKLASCYPTPHSHTPQTRNHSQLTPLAPRNQPPLQSPRHLPALPRPLTQTPRPMIRATLMPLQYILVLVPGLIPIPSRCPVPFQYPIPIPTKAITVLHPKTNPLNRIPVPTMVNRTPLRVDLLLLLKGMSL